MSENARKVGTVSRGIRCPIIRKGDDLARIVAESVIEAAESEGFELRDKDVISNLEFKFYSLLLDIKSINLFL